MTAQSRKSALEAASYCIELPLAVISVTLSYNYSSFYLKIFAEIISYNFLTVCNVYNSYIGI